MARTCHRPLSSVPWKHVSFQMFKLLAVVYIVPFLLTYVPSYIAVAGRRPRGADPSLPAVAVLVSMRDGTQQHYVMTPSLLREGSYRVAWDVQSSDSAVVDMVTALKQWENTPTSSSLNRKASLSEVQLSATNETTWCLFLPVRHSSDGGEKAQKVCRTGSLQGDYTGTRNSGGRSTTVAQVSILASRSQQPSVDQSSTINAGITQVGGFRKNPNKYRPSMAERFHPILPQVTFALLAGLQVYLFVVYWNGNVSASTIGKNFASMWQGGELWRALSGSTAHFDLWHIGLNLSAFYQLSQALQHSVPSILYLGLNLSFMIWVTVFWMLWQYAVYRQRLLADSAATLSSTPTVGYSGVLFALSTMVTLQRSQSCAIPFVDSICFSTYRVGRVALSVSPLIQLGIVQVILPRVSFAGHLAGIVVGYLYTWGWLPWSMYPSIVWPFWHFVYLVGIVPLANSNLGRRLGDARSWFGTAWTAHGLRVCLVVLVFSGFGLGWSNPLVWSYAGTMGYWVQATTTSENLVWKRAFCVYAVVLLMTHAVTIGAWMLLPTVWMTFSGLAAVLFQSLTLWGGLLWILDDLRHTEGIFYHMVGWAVVQPLVHLQSAWRTLRTEQTIRPFPGGGRRLRETEAELV